MRRFILSYNPYNPIITKRKRSFRLPQNWYQSHTMKRSTDQKVKNLKTQKSVKIIDLKRSSLLVSMTPKNHRRSLASLMTTNISRSPSFNDEHLNVQLGFSSSETRSSRSRILTDKNLKCFETFLRKYLLEQ